MAEYAYVGPVAHSSGNGNLPIHRIVIHCTAGGSDEGSARGTARYFRDPDSTGSAHAITDAYELVVCAYDTVVCWHAPPNTHSLGIEIECSLSNDGKGHWTLDSHQRKMRRAAKWVAEKCKLHGIPIRKLTVAQLQANPSVEGICGHRDVSLAFHQSTHTDPEIYFPWSQFIGYVQTAYAALTPAPPPATSTDWLDMATQAEVEAAVASGTEIGISNYMKRFFTDGQGTGDAIWDDSNSNATGLLNAVNGATDEQVLAAVQSLGVKLDALVAALTAPKV